ncbi:MAG: Eco57I restriction-modification methylase domain-containing protein [Desulfococcaceae bacterium]
METNMLTPKKSLNKAFLKIRPCRSDIEKFKISLARLVDGIDESESEEYHKNLVSDFLKDVYYREKHFINTKDRTDMVIHSGKDAKSSVSVIIETKKPGSRSEMLKKENISAKAFWELVLYYLRERVSEKNIEIRQIIATDIYEWFIFDARVFEKFFAQNRNLVKQFRDFEAHRLGGVTTDFFYKEIAEPFISEVKSEIPFTHFDIREYEKALKNPDENDEKRLAVLYKIFSPEHLLKLPFANDSNTLDRNFYAELLHIIGLTESGKGGKKIIERKKEKERCSGSLMENTILTLQSMKKIDRLEKSERFGASEEEKLFSAALELVITWINRILFLKLLEAQLISCHKGDKSFSFLNSRMIQNFSDLDVLFFYVLARKTEERLPNLKQVFAKVPYLNSSLFEPAEIEHLAFSVSSLAQRKKLGILSSTVLKDRSGKKRTGEMNTLEYLFAFLDAYDFAAEGGGEIQEESRTLVSASVLGLIFEKINGYKDGSFFTPGFITMYMARETVRRAVLQKFNERKGWNCKDFDELYNRIEDQKEANEIVNSLKICDPAVGSGHFLVSALNEIIAVKNDLKILLDRQGRRLKEYHIEVAGDELTVTDEDGELFAYNPKNRESQRIQETLFHEKQMIIENCLFGVDINPNSVKICRLRLWIELLKNAYYKADGELETLPNIDINIRCGNSLVSRFPLDADVRQILKKSRWTVESYRTAVQTYRHARSFGEKMQLEKLISCIKKDFRVELGANSPKVAQMKKLGGELYDLLSRNHLFAETAEEKNERERKQRKLEAEIKHLSAEMEDLQNGKMYDNAFEWRFEFPEMLSDDGDFTGFDIVIGNPPYIRQESFSEIKPYLQSKFEIYRPMSDLLTYFVEQGYNLLKDRGVFQFVISGKFTRAAYGQAMRKFLAEKTRITHYIDFGGIPVFDEATVDAAVTGFVKEEANENSQFILGQIKKGDDFVKDFQTYISNHAVFYPAKALTENTWSFEDTDTLALARKIQKAGTPLKNWNIIINRGILTGCNEAFVIDEETRNRLIAEDPKSAEIIKPLLRGRDIQKYKADKPVNWLIGTHNGIKDVLDKIEPDDFPAIRSFLDKHWDKISARCDKGETPYHLRNCAYWQDFEKPKLVWKRIGSILRFCYDQSGAYCLDSTCIATGEKVKFLCAVLNSRLCNWDLFRTAPKTGTGDLIISVQALEPLHVPVPNKKQEKAVLKLFDQILAAKKKNPEADTSGPEKEIDRLVYELYGLTEEEIAIAEGKKIDLLQNSKI